MRIIDADKLKYYGNHIGDEYEDRFHDFQYVDRDQIDKAPSIDIVCCKDCKYWVSDGGALMICDIHKDPTVPDHYCSYGEEDKDE